MQPDHGIADELYAKLVAEGHQVFWAAKLDPGEKWPDRITEDLSNADIFIVLLSSHAARSINVQGEIHKALELHDRSGLPKVIPVRLVSDNELPYPLEYNVRQHTELKWQDAEDTAALIESILHVAATKKGKAAAASVNGVASIPITTRAKKLRAQPNLSKFAPVVRDYLSRIIGWFEPIDEQLFLSYIAHDLLIEFSTLVRVFCEDNWDDNDLTFAENLQEDLSKISQRLDRQTEYKDHAALYTSLTNGIEAVSLAIKSAGQFEAQRDGRLKELQAYIGSLRSASNDNEASRASIDRRDEKGQATIKADFESQMGALRLGLRQIHEAVLRVTASCVDVVGENRGWLLGDRAFTQSPEEHFRISESLEADVNEALQTLAKMRRQRPGDPFLLLRYASVAGAQVATPSEAKDLLVLAMQATTQIPGLELYDRYRESFLYQVAWLGTRAAMLTVDMDSYENSDPVIPNLALGLWEFFERLFGTVTNLSDVIDRVNLLGFAHRYREALDYGLGVHEQLWSDDLATYIMACVASVNREIDLALKWFEHLIKDLKYLDIKKIQSDRDFEQLRLARPADWGRLTNFSAQVYISCGLMMDDICLRNASAFPITNVKLKAYTHWTNGLYRTIDLKTDRIEPNQTKTWENVAHVKGIRWQTLPVRAYLECDQVSGELNRGQKAIGEP